MSSESRPNAEWVVNNVVEMLLYSANEACRHIQSAMLIVGKKSPYYDQLAEIGKSLAELNLKMALDFVEPEGSG